MRFADNTFVLAFSSKRTAYLFKLKVSMTINIIVLLIIFTKIATSKTMNYFIFEMISIPFTLGIKFTKPFKSYWIPIPNSNKKCLN